MLTHHNQSGFTLIELMIVVAIIGILAAVAIPAYQDYTKRSRVAEGLSMADIIKTNVSEYYASSGNWPASNLAAGMPSSIYSMQGSSVRAVQVSGNQIIVFFRTNVAPGDTVILQGTTLSSGSQIGAIHWVCTGGTLNSKYRPSTCRQ